ncbi:MAG: polysaccharide export protein [Sphingomonadaceae bacterium]|jgi:polysaccharide biosynthesis/export protein|nr:MAG: polysaccharide export protein [Sphingomonadaceae bacterium]
MSRRPPASQPLTHRSARNTGFVLAACASLAACGVQSPLPMGAQAYSVIPAASPSPAAAGYVLGANDTISLRVFNEPELSYESLQVDPAGNVSIPLLGAVRAEGRSPEELSRYLESALTRYIHRPQVAIALVESGQTVTVEGAVNKPGVFPIRGTSTLIEALALAESPTHIAANDQIFVFRTIHGRRAGARFDIRRIRAGIDPNPVLLPGDEVVVGFSALKQAWREYFGAPVFNLFRIL